MDVLLYICCIFSEHLFLSLRIPLDDCFCTILQVWWNKLKSAKNFLSNDILKMYFHIRVSLLNCFSIWEGPWKSFTSSFQKVTELSHCKLSHCTKNHFSQIPEYHGKLKVSSKYSFSVYFLDEKKTIFTISVFKNMTFSIINESMNMIFHEKNNTILSHFWEL